MRNESSSARPGGSPPATHPSSASAVVLQDMLYVCLPKGLLTRQPQHCLWATEFSHASLRTGHTSPPDRAACALRLCVAARALITRNIVCDSGCAPRQPPWTDALPVPAPTWPILQHPITSSLPLPAMARCCTGTCPRQRLARLGPGHRHRPELHQRGGGRLPLAADHRRGRR